MNLSLYGPASPPSPVCSNAELGRGPETLHRHDAGPHPSCCGLLRSSGCRGGGWPAAAAEMSTIVVRSSWAGTESPGPRPGVDRSACRDGTSGLISPDISPLGYDLGYDIGRGQSGRYRGVHTPRLNQSATSVMGRSDLCPPLAPHQYFMYLRL